MIKGIIFDFDGTLFDSMGIWVGAGGLYLQSVGKTAEKGLWDKIKDMSMLRAAAYLKETYDIPLTEEQIVDGINKIIEDFYFYEAMPKDDVVSVLSDLKKKGIKMCIATATDRHLVEAALKRCGMFGYFDSVFTCTEVGHGKGEPDIYEACRRAMRTEKSETAVFEDAYYAARTAKNAGFFVAGVYDRHEKRAEEMKELADTYIENFSDLEEIL